MLIMLSKIYCDLQEPENILHHHHLGVNIHLIFIKKGKMLDDRSRMA